jgi:hypothetical protein
MISINLSPTELSDLTEWMAEKGLTQEEVIELAKRRLLDELYR